MPLIKDPNALFLGKAPYILLVSLYIILFVFT